MSAGVGLALGAGALWLLSQLRGGASSGGAGVQPNDPNTGGVNPSTQPQNNVAKDVATAAGYVQLGVGLVGGVVGTLKTAGIIGGAGGASAGSGGGGAAVTGGAAGTKSAVSAGISAGLAIHNIGAAVVGMGWLITLAVALVTEAIDGALQSYAKAAGTFVNGTVGPSAQWFFDRFMQQAQASGKVRVVAASSKFPGVQVPGWKIVYEGLDAETLRKLVLTSMFLNYVGNKHRNDLLNMFYVNSGFPEGRRMMFSPTEVFYAPGGRGDTQVSSDYWGNYYSRVFGIEPSRLLSTLYCVSPGCNGSTIANVTSPGEMQAAAVELLGDAFNAAVAQLQFQATVSALALAGQQTYTEGFYPGDLRFTENLRDMMLPGWSVEQATFWSTAKHPTAAVWVIDPVSGNRIAPAEIRRHWKIAPYVSVKGQEVMPGVFAGFRRVVSGRRLAGFSGEAVAADGTLVGSSDPRAIVNMRAAAKAAALADGRVLTQAQPFSTGGGISPLVLLGGGALALLLLKKGG